MTGLTLESLMAAIQFEVGLPIVIKPPVIPAAGIVKQLTICPQATFMFFFLLVTCVACCWRVIKCLLFVTLFTFNPYVLAQ